MGQRIRRGDKLPFFTYDTPFAAGESFRELLAAEAPLVVVFLANFGHPVTRTLVRRYVESFPALGRGGLAVVVRSAPARLAQKLRPQSLPFPLICDAEGVLYEHLGIPQKTGTLRTCSLEAWKILRAAKKQGYRPEKGAPQQLPLTLILGHDGTVAFCHYGTSLTDVPEDCAAMEQLLAALATPR